MYPRVLGNETLGVGQRNGNSCPSFRRPCVGNQANLRRTDRLTSLLSILRSLFGCFSDVPWSFRFYSCFSPVLCFPFISRAILVSMKFLQTILRSARSGYSVLSASGLCCRSRSVYGSEAVWVWFGDAEPSSRENLIREGKL